MNVKFFGAAAFLVAALAPALSFGQVVSPYATDYPHTPSPYVGGYAGYGGYPYSHASTAEEGFLTGYGNYYQGLGAFHKDYAEALSGYERARSLALQNYLAEYNTRIALIDARKQRATDEMNVIADRNRTAQANFVPTKNEPQRIVRQDGSITWPAELQGPEFAAHRAAIELDFQFLAAGMTKSAGEIDDKLDRLVRFAGDKVRRGESDPSTLTSALSVRDKAEKTARQWTAAVANAKKQVPVAASY